MNNIKFGTGGFRAIIGEDFNKENVLKICQAISNIIIQKKLKKEICIGYDNRFMSENFALWCAEVFAGNNINVEIFDRATTTPVAMFATKKKDNDYGIMITASHNPYIYNGIKVFTKGGKDADLIETEEIEKEIFKVKAVSVQDFKTAINTKIKIVNYLEEYVDSIIKLTNLTIGLNNLKVVFDAKYGSSVEEINMLCNKINLQSFDILNLQRDAFFGFELPAPKEENIDKLITQVKNTKAQIGFALDADGDRLAVVDENGKFVDNNYILAIVYYFLIKYCNKKGHSVKNVATSNLLDLVSKQFGYECKEVPVGFKYVSSALIKYKAVVGGECSGGLAIQGHILGKDSLLAIAICLKAMSVMQKPFSQILNEVKEFVGGYNKIILDKEYSYTKKQKIFIDNLLFIKKQVPKHRYELDKIVFDDYIKIYYKNGNWSLIRFSGTEPILRIFAEADTIAEAKQLISDWQELLKLNNQ